ncbi:MAG: Spy/CpxP family protein refolding chaperone [Nitrospirota bacterium]|jgi:Spy/CpxP family protein refolding chaperone
MQRSKLPSLLILATIAALLMVVAPATAGHGPHPGPPDRFVDGPDGPPPAPPERFFAEHADELGIDQATLDQIRAIVDQSRAEGHTLYDQVRRERRTMRDLLDEESPDEAAVMAQADVVGDAMTALKKHHLATMLKIRALLTPEQRAALAEIRREMGPRRHHGGPFDKRPR